MDEKLILNDGTVIAGHIIVSDNRLFLYMYSISFYDAFIALSDPDNVKTIKWENGSEKGTLKGFKHLYAVTEESNELVTAALKKE